MTEISDGQYATRTQGTHDLLSGEELLIAYFPEAGVVTINGHSVTRSPKLENSASQAIFHRALGDKLFTVSTDSFSRLFL